MLRQACRCGGGGLELGALSWRQGLKELTRDTAKSYFWNQLAVVLDGAALMLATVVVGRVSGAERLGEFGQILSVAGLTVMVAGLGLRESAAVLVQRTSGDEPGLAGFLRLCLGVRSAGALAAGLVIAVLVLLDGRSPAVAAAAAAYVAAILVSNFIATFDLALFRARAVAAGKLASAVTALALVAAGAMLDSTAVILSGLAAGAVAGTIFYAWPLRALVQIKARSYPFSSVMALSWTLWLAAIFNYIVNLQGVQAVMWVARVEPASVGHFTAGLAIAMAANRLFVGGFANIILAAFSRADAAGQRGDFAALHSLYVRATAVMTLPVLLGALVFADELAGIFLVEETAPAATVIRILAGFFVAGRLLGGGAHSSGLFATGGHVAALAIRAGFAVVMFVATWMAAYFGGIGHVAVAAGAVSVTVIAVEWLCLAARQSIRLPTGALIRTALMCGAGALVAMIVAAGDSPARTAAGVVTYVVLQAAALRLARPLARGEVASMGVAGMVARVLGSFEARGASNGH